MIFVNYLTMAASVTSVSRMSRNLVGMSRCICMKRMGVLAGRNVVLGKGAQTDSPTMQLGRHGQRLLPCGMQNVQHSRALTQSISRLSRESVDAIVDETDVEDDALLEDLELKPKGYMAARPVDDVYMLSHYPPQQLEFGEAIEKLREQDKWAHCRKPEKYRDRTVTISMHLDMALQKKKKVIPFQSIVILPHPFKEDDKVLCFAEEADFQVAKDAGASVVGGEEIANDILSHAIHHRSFDYCVATPEMMPKLSKLKEKLRKRFPNSKRGSVSSNIPAMVNLYRKGQEYKVQNRHSTINCAIGKLSLRTDQLEENMAAIISDVCTHKPADMGPFIKKLTVTAFLLDGHRVNPNKYLPVPDEEKKLKEELEKMKLQD